MDVTPATWVVAVAGLVLIVALGAAQLVAIVRPRAQATVEKVYGGDPSTTDPTAYFAYNQGLAWADVVSWVPLQLAGSIGMLLGERWGFLLALAAAVPFVYSAFGLFIWDRDLGFRGRHWLVAWAVWPAFGLVQGIYCFVRLVD